MAKTVMKVIYADGNERAFFGLGKTRRGEINLALELRRHKQNVYKRREQVMEATIYKNHYPVKVEPSKTEVIMHYEKGVWR